LKIDPTSVKQHQKNF